MSLIRPCAARQPVRRAALALALVLAPAALGAQERVDAAAIQKIREEGTQRSQVMEIASWLTDVYGPRLTNSPQSRAAGEWAVKTMQGWGLANVHQEWFPFGRGWQNDRMVAHVVSPTPYPVLAFPGAWTVGTNGPVTADLAIVELPQSATERRLREVPRPAAREDRAGRAAAHRRAAHVGSRHADDAEQLDRLAATEIVPATPAPAGPQRPGAPAGPGGPPRAGGPGAPAGPGARPAGAPSPQEVRNQFWVTEGVIAVLTPGTSRGNSGSVSNAPTGNRQPTAPASVPQIGVSAEHYGRMYRQVAEGAAGADGARRAQPLHERGPQLASTSWPRSPAPTPSAGRGRDARRALRLVARRHRRHGQRRGSRRDDGGDAHPQDARRCRCGARCAWRSGRARSRGSSARAQYVAQHFGDPTPSSRSPEHGKFIGVLQPRQRRRARSAACTCRATSAVAPIFARVAGGVRQRRIGRAR